MNPNKNDYSKQLMISLDYFKHILDEYDSWPFAWYRETARNAEEAGATQINYAVSADQKSVTLSVTDNGCGMALETLRHDLLTLGGSSKKQQDHDHSYIQYGFSKNIILFAHQRYQIYTRAYLVTGQGDQYSIEPADDYLNGTSIAISVDSNANLFRLRQSCRILAYQYDTEISISLNGRVLKKGCYNFEHQLELPVGIFYFNEKIAQDNAEVFYWVRLNGLPLFSSYLYSSGNYNIDGVLDLMEESAQFLMTNHEDFKYEICQLLNTFFHELSHSGHKLESNLINI